MSLGSLLRQPVMWGLLITYGCQVYWIYLFLTWLPSYIRTVRHLNLFNAGWLATLPYVVTTIGLVLLGLLSAALLKNKDLSRGARRHLMIVMMVLASCVLFVPFAEDLIVMEALVIGSVLFATAANTLIRTGSRPHLRQAIRRRRVRPAGARWQQLRIHRTHTHRVHHRPHAIIHVELRTRGHPAVGGYISVLADGAQAASACRDPAEGGPATASIVTLRALGGRSWLGEAGGEPVT
jgi:hypothetical protein